MVAVPRAFFVLAIVAAVGLSGLAVGLDSPVALSRSNPVHGLPLVFERYENQRSGEVQFVSRTPGYTVFIEPRQVTMAFRRPSFANHAARPFVRMRMLQSNPSSALPEEPQLAKANYFVGNDPTRWRTNVSLFGRVRFPSVYKNIDLVYYGNHHQLEYDFVIRPGGAPQSIRFSVSGANRARIEQSGDLVLQAGEARAILHRPLAYQIINAQRRDVAASFLPLGGSRFGIRVARYDRKSPLIIDPVLAYSTYLGGSDDEGIFGIGFDEDGNIYVAGETSSLDFPQKGAVQNHLGGNYDAFVSKFDAQGAHLIYSTYLGGAKYDHAIGVQVDKHGGVYLAGITRSPDFPVKNALQAALAGRANGFASKLSLSGSELEFSTYKGATDSMRSPPWLSTMTMLSTLPEPQIPWTSQSPPTPSRRSAMAVPISGSAPGMPLSR